MRAFAHVGMVKPWVALAKDRSPFRGGISFSLAYSTNLSRNSRGVLTFKILHHSRGRLCHTFCPREFLVCATIPAGMFGAVTRLHDGQFYSKTDVVIRTAKPQWG